jgi:hypothetical protein
MSTENQPHGPQGTNPPPRHDAPAGSYQGRTDARDGGISRFLGGSPLGVAFRLVLLSILVGVVLAVIGLDPWNIVYSVRRLFWAIWDLGFGAIDSLWRYFLLGAVIVIPIWLISRMVNAPKGR